MPRRYLIPILCTLLYTSLGIALGLLWWAYTGRTDMPWWIAILLVTVASLISDVVEETVQHHRYRRREQGPARHAKEAR